MRSTFGVSTSFGFGGRGAVDFFDQVETSVRRRGGAWPWGPRRWIEGVCECRGEEEGYGEGGAAVESFSSLDVVPPTRVR